MATNNQQLARNEGQPQSLKSILNSDAMRQQFAAALPKHLTADRFVRVGLTALTRTPKLMDCTQESFFRCLLDLSAMGIEPDNRRAYLIPYGKECTLVVGYQGLSELAMRSGAVASIHADKVCENDVFIVDRGEIKAHSIDYKKDRGPAFAYYALVKFKDGAEKAEVMTREEVEAIRKRSRSGNNGPWVTDFDEMAKKTVFRRCSKWIPLSPEIRETLEKSDEHEFGDIRNVTPSMPTVPTVDPFAPKGAITEKPAVQEAPAVDAEQIPLEEQPEQEW
jgi:recombination protein RecT